MPSLLVRSGVVFEDRLYSHKSGDEERCREDVRILTVESRLLN